MRTHGNICKWNSERGFGFISPADGHGEVFVHISAFPRDGRSPCVGEMVSFEIEVDAQGRRRASAVLRPGVAARAARQPSRHAMRGPRSGGRGRAFAFVMLAAVLCYGGYRTLRRIHLEQQPAAPMQPLPLRADDVTSVAAPYRCDGRTRCPQMRSCEEATWFINHCPGTEMDGDHDGVPCEQEHCPL